MNKIFLMLLGVLLLLITNVSAEKITFEKEVCISGVIFHGEGYYLKQIKTCGNYTIPEINYTKVSEYCKDKCLKEDIDNDRDGLEDPLITYKDFTQCYNFCIKTEEFMNKLNFNSSVFDKIATCHLVKIDSLNVCNEKDKKDCTPIEINNKHKAETIFNLYGECKLVNKKGICKAYYYSYNNTDYYITLGNLKNTYKPTKFMSSEEDSSTEELRENEY